MTEKKKGQSKRVQQGTETGQEVQVNLRHLQEVAAQLRDEQPLLSFEEAADAHVRRNKDALTELAKW